MATTNYLAARSSNLSTFNAININYSTLMGNTVSVAQFSFSTMQLQSTIVSLGQSSNNKYTTLAGGGISTIGNWVTSIPQTSGMTSISTLSMSANGQYQIVQSGNTGISNSLSLTSNSGQTWSGISNTSGLPANTTVYTCAALSGTGQYGLVGTNNGNVYMTNNYCNSFTTIYLNPGSISYIKISSSGQYMLVTIANGGLYLFRNLGTLWAQVTSVLSNTLWNGLAISASGQYMVANAPYNSSGSLIAQGASSSSSWTSNNVVWTATASSNLSTAWQLFDASETTRWTSDANYVTGVYNNTNVTLVSGLFVYGEWFQIQSSIAIQLYSYRFTVGAYLQFPSSFTIAGSTDGITWYLIQSVTVPSNPSSVDGATSAVTTSVLNPLLTAQSVMYSSGPGGTFNCTYPASSIIGNSYTYFRFIAKSTFTSTTVSLNECYFNFNSGGSYYSVNFGLSWLNTAKIPVKSAFAISGSGQYAIGVNDTSTSSQNTVLAYVSTNYLQEFISGTGYITPTFTPPFIGQAYGTANSQIPNVPIVASCSQTGQYMVLVTNNSGGANVYYSSNYGTTFTGITIGNAALTSCAMSSDGSYITVSNNNTVYTLNNNSNGYSVSIGTFAGLQNQSQNAIAIGSFAGVINQTANSIILNASGTTINSYVQGFYVAPIASYTASSSQSFALLGYGTGTGSDNQVVQTVLNVNISGFQNLFIGQNTGQQNTTGYGNLFFGLNTGQQNTTGYGNLFIGQNAGQQNTTGYGNLFFGLNTGQQNTTGYGNLFIGQNAGQQNTTGYLNTFLGLNTGQQNTTGYGNIYIGKDVGIVNTTGYQNVIIGQSAGFSITTGYNTTIIGNSAGLAVTTSLNNSFFGTAAGRGTTIGNENTFIGTLAGAGNITGSSNICVGKSANTSTSSIANEIVLGAGVTGQAVIFSGSSGVTYMNRTSINCTASSYGGGMRIDSYTIAANKTVTFQFTTFGVFLLSYYPTPGANNIQGGMAIITNTGFITAGSQLLTPVNFITLTINTPVDGITITTPVSYGCILTAVQIG